MLMYTIQDVFKDNINVLNKCSVYFFMRSEIMENQYNKSVSSNQSMRSLTFVNIDLINMIRSE